MCDLCKLKADLCNNKMDETVHLYNVKINSQSKFYKMENSNKSTNEDFKMTGNWEQQSNLLKEKFPQLTVSDLKFEEGKENELLTRLQERLNKGREEVVNIIRKGQTEKK